MAVPSFTPAVVSKFKRVMLLAAALALVAGASHADMRRDRGSERGGGRAYSRDADRSHHGRGGANKRGDGRTYKRGDGRGHFGGGGRTYKRGDGHGGGNRRYSRGRVQTHGGGRSYSVSYRSYGGGRHYGGRVRAPICNDTYAYRVPVRSYSHYRYGRPRSSVGFGIGFSTHYYRPAPVIIERAPVYVAPPERVYVDPGPTIDETDRDYDDEAPLSPDDLSEIDVTNEPPDGCYYYDTSCRQRFANLDDYTEHLESHRHTQTIAIVRSDRKETIRMLEFVDGYWQVQQ